MCGGMQGSRPIEIALRPSDRILCAAHRGVGSLELSAQLRNFQHGQSLSSLNAIANIHVNLANVPRDFSVNLDFLKWPELPGQGEGTRNRFALDQHHRGWRCRRLGLTRFHSRATELEPCCCKQSNASHGYQNVLTPDFHFHPQANAVE